jgi:WYL_2, Sm-like SH3 beta-barrel fold
MTNQIGNEPQAFDTEEGRTWLKSMLRMGPVDVTFTKADGTERVMKCTLQEGVVIPHEKTTDRVKEENPHNLAVWDMEKNAWRSFRLSNVKQVRFDI